MSAAQEATETPEVVWTPPSIPEPLGTPGGEPPTPVGAGVSGEAPPQQAAHPVSDIEGTAVPGEAGTPSVPGAPVVEPFEPAVPAEGDATPAAEEVGDVAATVTMAPAFEFVPNEVTISVGETVAWLNSGRSPQTVTCDPARVREEGLVQLPEGADPWDSGVINSGDSFTHTFDVAGEYVYASMNIAVDMSGRVIVQE